MPFNGSGVFNRVYSWQNDAANGIDIRADRMDTDTNDITANGLGLCLTRDGQGQPSSNLNMNGYRWTNAADGVGAQDFATVNQLNVASALTLALKSSNYTVVAGVGIIECDASGGAFTITYPVALTSVRPVKIVKIDATTNAVNISNGTSVVGSLTFPAFGANYQSFDVYSNGSTVRLT